MSDDLYTVRAAGRLFFSLWPPSDWQGLAEAVAARRAAAARMRNFILKKYGSGKKRILQRTCSCFRI